MGLLTHPAKWLDENNWTYFMPKQNLLVVDALVMHCA